MKSRRLVELVVAVIAVVVIVVVAVLIIAASRHSQQRPVEVRCPPGYVVTPGTGGARATCTLRP